MTKAKHILDLLFEDKKEDLAKIDKIIDEFMPFFPNTPKPIVQLSNRRVHTALGEVRSSYEIATGKLTSITMVIQRDALQDENTAKRVVAHEMIHVWQDNSITPEERKKKIAMKRMLGRSGDIGHGKDFLDKAEEINKVYGDKFITVTSDKEYVVKQRPYYILVFLLSGQGHRLRLGYQVSMTDPRKKKGEYLARRMRDSGAKLFMSDDPELVHGPSIGSASVAAPSIEDRVKRLTSIYDGNVFVELKIPEFVKEEE